LRRGVSGRRRLLRRLLPRGHRLGAVLLREALHAALGVDHELAVEALSEASRYGHPVYDLLYAVLARREGCKVLTFDRRLTSLLRELGISVIGGESAALAPRA
ncbi:type II toxin-antitoxin system VapC family toxin, partial [Acidobacteria bacterium ACD]|nr:type II toxin-antitoxin system VapC family toxin [Acidobacteria bacterium ACD]